MCRAGALLTQAPLSPSGFAFATQLPDSAEQAAEAMEAVMAGSSPAQQQQQPGQPLRPSKKQAAAAEDGDGENSLQGSVGRSQGSDGSGGGEGGVDSRSRRLSGSSWLLTPLGALAQVFKRNATQVGGGGRRQVDAALAMPLLNLGYVSAACPLASLTGIVVPFAGCCRPSRPSRRPRLAPSWPTRAPRRSLPSSSARA